jgi:hypothetical protein
MCCTYTHETLEISPRWVDSGRNLGAIELAIPNITQDDTTGGSALLIGQRGKQSVIYSFRVAEVSQVFVYDPALAHGRGVLEADNSETVPVWDARN